MIKYFSLFSGIGAFEAALDNLGIDYELVGYSEIDKYASKAYSAIHGVSESMNYGDITKIDEKKLPKDIDLISYGFPCQDISLAGKQKGLFNEDGSQTRSGLFFDALRIIEETQPKVAIAENVKNLVGKKFKEQFEIVLDSLEQAGYNNYWKVLNSKDFGIPQNRERVFIVSIRKDVDTGVFEFPKGYPLDKRLKDLLEDEVDEKFYMKDDKIQPLLNGTYTPGTYPYNPMDDGTCRTIKNQYFKNSQANFIKQTDQGATAVLQVGNVNPSGRGQNGQVVDSEGLARTITIEKGEGQKILVREPFIVASRGRNPENPSDRTTGSPTEQRLEPNSQGICNTLTTVQKDNLVVEPQCIQAADLNHYQNDQMNRVYSVDGISPTILTKTGGGRETKILEPPHLRIRKLTPKECFRLQGFSDESYEKAASVCSNTQLYKQAGNSITVDVLEELFCMMFDEDGNFFI